MSTAPPRRVTVIGLALLALAAACAACHPNQSNGQGGAGAPYVWVCTPAHYANSASNTIADLYVFNGGAAAANVSVNILNSAGVNLFGEAIPGTSPVQSDPGQTGSSTVAVAPGNTLNVTWQTPQVTGFPAPDPAAISWSVRVTSDQPIVVGTDFQFSGFHPLPCSLLPK